jgi:hypothetical protein
MTQIDDVQSKVSIIEVTMLAPAEIVQTIF